MTVDRLPYALLDIDALDRLAPQMAGLTSDEKNQWINLISAVVRKYTGRNLLAHSYSYVDSSAHYDPGRAVVDGTGRQKLFMPEWPLLSVDTVYLDGSAKTQRSLTTVASYSNSSKYVVYRDEGYLYLEGGWNRGHKNIHLVYRAGYSPSTHPDAVQELQGIAAALMAEARGRVLAGGAYRSERIGDYQYTLRSEVEGITQDLISGPLGVALDGYRRPLNRPSPGDFGEFV
jgi:hypothetical protein